jgi:RING finger protein 113A
MAGTDEPVAVFKKRNNKTNLRKRPATPPPEDSPSSSDSDDFGSDDDQGDGPKVKRPRKAGVSAGATHGKDDDKADIIDVLGVTKYAGDRSTTIDISNDATKQSNWYDEKDLLGTTRVVKEPVTSAISLSGKDKRKAPGTMGPVKAPTNVRMVTVTDYAPDVCKDYKQTGFCGFGDGCKFLHAREDYKQGWALDKEWESVTKGSKKAMKGTIVASASNRNGENAAKDEAEDEKEAKELEKIPFKCVICKDDYKDPIVTRCNHYFCERCAIGRYKKNANCAQCGNGTNGVFNVARNLKKILEKKLAREERLKKEAEEEEEDDE